MFVSEDLAKSVIFMDEGFPPFHLVSSPHTLLRKGRSRERAIQEHSGIIFLWSDFVFAN